MPLALVLSSDPLARAGLVARLAELGWEARVEVNESGDADAIVWDLGEAEPDEGPPEVDAPSVALVRDEAQARLALSYGARAALLRESADTRLAAALDAVRSGLIAIDENLAELTLRSPSAPLPSMEPLTPREREVLDQLALGLSNREIAEKLSMSAHTAKFHVNSLMSKLGAASRGEVVAIAARAGLVTF